MAEVGLQLLRSHCHLADWGWQGICWAGPWSGFFEAARNWSDHFAQGGLEIILLLLLLFLPLYITISIYYYLLLFYYYLLFLSTKSRRMKTPIKHVEVLWSVEIPQNFWMKYQAVAQFWSNLVQILHMTQPAFPSLQGAFGTSEKSPVGVCCGISSKPVSQWSSLQHLCRHALYQLYLLTSTSDVDFVRKSACSKEILFMFSGSRLVWSSSNWNSPTLLSLLRYRLCCSPAFTQWHRRPTHDLGRQCHSMSKPLFQDGAWCEPSIFWSKR